MTTPSNLPQPNQSANTENNSVSQAHADVHSEQLESLNGNGSDIVYRENLADNEALAAIATVQSSRASTENSRFEGLFRQPPALPLSARSSTPAITLLAVIIMVLGLWIDSFWIGLAGAVVALLASLRVVWPILVDIIEELVSKKEQSIFVASLGLLAAIIGLAQLTGVTRQLQGWFRQLNWEAVGALGDVFGALGQILIAILAVYIAWRQYVISKDLTIQQNLITQQQTIDTYFQGISDLVLDEQGLLEDWPQERAIAEGRTAAILGSVDAGGKAKVIRFLSRAKLLTPLRRDRRLGRAILDGTGGYEEDRVYGVRVIDLGVMLAGANLAGTDLRWTDLSEANFVRANLSQCDLVKANLARAILYEAQLRGADLAEARLFYGSLETATPRSRTEPPDYKSGAQTGAVVEKADFTGAQLTEEQRYYCCTWGGSKTRKTILGGCDGIPNKLGR